MARNISDQMGRALEYAIVEYFIDNTDGIAPIGATLHDQVREKVKFDGLTDEQQAHYELSAEKIFEWAGNEWDLAGSKDVNIERLPDSAAKQGDVTDIRLTIDGEIHNLSIKHNHTALKHQRPGSLPQQCGFAKKTEEDKDYRKKYQTLKDTFLENVEANFPHFTEFNEIKAEEGNFINKNLYDPICSLYTEFLNEHGKNPEVAQFFFSFLVGMMDFYKLVVYAEHIEVMEFAEMPSVKRLDAEQVSDSYINVDFFNGWKISMRLHTASSRFEGVSLKFDTQPLDIDVNKEIIDL